MTGDHLSRLEYEILDCLANDAETTVIVLDDIRRPVNAASFSAEAKALDHETLDAVFARFADQGLVARLQAITDGLAAPRPGVTYTWSSMTAEGRRVWEGWDSR